MDLQQFGKQLQTLRKAAGLSQEGLVEALDQRARLGPAAEYRAVDGTLISRWEHARTQAGRQWKPTRTYVLHLIHLFAQHLTLATAQQWATQAGYQIAAAELADLFPSAMPFSAITPNQEHAGAASTAPRHNLPRVLTSFVGRESEIAQLTESLLTPATRLLTIVGEGGIGKTRLALATAQRILDFRFWILDSSTVASPDNPKSKIQNPKFPDGVWFVSLAGLDASSSANLANSLATAIAKALNFSFPSATLVPAAQLIHHLRSKTLLLILDNFEQLAAGATFIVELLQQAEQIRVLATSRTPLNCQAEQLLWLNGLPLLATNGAQAPGLQLFSERTRQQMPDFVLDAKGVQEVVQLCQLINSNPLAIELAAHWMQHYSLNEMISLLQAQNLALLATDQQDVPLRHRAMSAVFETSWQLLSRSQQEALAQSSLLRGAFTREAFLAVTHAPLPALVALVNSSLLRQTRDVAGHVFYSMHELLRQFAASKLATIDQTTPGAQRRHSQYYLQMVAAHGSQLYGLQTQSALAELQANIDNLRAAWRWAVTNRDSDLLAAAWPGLRSYYHVCSHYQEGEELFCLAASELGNQPPLLDSDLPQAIAVAQAFFLNLLHRCAQALALVQTVLAAWPEPRPTQRPIWVQAHLEWGIGLSLLEKHEAAIAKLQEVARWAQEMALPVVAARALFAMQRNLVTQGEFTQAKAMLEQVLHHYRQAGYRLAEGFVLRSLAHHAYKTGHYPAALAYLQEALTIYQATEDQPRTIALWKYLGEVYTALGQWGQAQHYFQAALAQSKEAQEPTYTADVLHGCARFFGALGDYRQAEAYSQRALELNRQFGRPSGTAETLCTLGWVQNQLGQAEAALAHYREAVALLQQANASQAEGMALLGLGKTLALLGRNDEAVAVYQQALAVQQACGQQQHVIQTWSAIAAVALLQGDLTTALQRVEEILSSVDLATTQGIREPLACALVCYQVLQANGDPRAAPLVESAWQRLQAQAATIDDETLRQSFLKNVKVNRALVAAYQPRVRTPYPDGASSIQA